MVPVMMASPPEASARVLTKSPHWPPSKVEETTSPACEMRATYAA